MKRLSLWFNIIIVALLAIVFATALDRRYIPSELAISVAMSVSVVLVVVAGIIFINEEVGKDFSRRSRKKGDQNTLYDIAHVVYLLVVPFVSYVGILGLGSFYTYHASESRLSKYTVSLQYEENRRGNKGFLRGLKCRKKLKADSKYSDIVYAYYCLDDEGDIFWTEKMKVCPYVKTSIFGIWISDWNLASSKNGYKKVSQNNMHISTQFMSAEFLLRKAEKFECI
ncbi:hypothetical protein ACJJIG_17385 [Microbulbifer sp. SSSA007]|uniref:hypothetical protein n=1 Tax=Microbulbifer sp. SSSA007 TaxID=3243379 RepID=UPI004039D963